jgi:hypothetical protein
MAKVRILELSSNVNADSIRRLFTAKPNVHPFIYKPFKAPFRRPHRLPPIPTTYNSTPPFLFDESSGIHIGIRGLLASSITAFDG